VRLSCAHSCCDRVSRDHTILAVVTRAGFLPGHFFCVTLKTDNFLGYSSVPNSPIVSTIGQTNFFLALTSMFAANCFSEPFN